MVYFNKNLKFNHRPFKSCYFIISHTQQQISGKKHDREKLVLTFFSTTTDNKDINFKTLKAPTMFFIK